MNARKMWGEDAGQDLIEYALLVALLATAVIVVLNSPTNQISTMLNYVTNAVSNAS